MSKETPLTYADILSFYAEAERTNPEVCKRLYFRASDGYEVNLWHLTQRIKAGRPLSPTMQEAKAAILDKLPK